MLFYRLVSLRNSNTRVKGIVHAAFNRPDKLNFPANHSKCGSWRTYAPNVGETSDKYFFYVISWVALLFMF